MKRLIVLFLFIPALVWSGEVATINGVADSAITSIDGVAGTGIVSISGVDYDDGDAGDSYTDLVLFYRCEALQMGVGDTYGTDSLWTDSSTEMISGTAEKSGTNGLLVQYSDQHCIADNNGQYVLSEGRFGTWVEVTTFGNYMGLFKAFNVGGDFVLVQLQGSSTDMEVSVQWSKAGEESVAFTTTTANMTNAGTVWYFVEGAWKQSTNYMEVWVDGVSKGSTTSNTLLAWANALTTVFLGEFNSIEPVLYYMDVVMLSTSSTRDLYALSALTSTPKP